MVFWSIISVIVQIPLTIYLYYIMKRDIKFKLDSRILLYLMIGIAVFALTSYLMEEYLVLNENIFEFLPQVLIYLAFSIALYLGITLLIDKKTQKLVKGIISEFRKKN